VLGEQVPHLDHAEQGTPILNNLTTIAWINKLASMLPRQTSCDPTRQVDRWRLLEQLIEAGVGLTMADFPQDTKHTNISSHAQGRNIKANERVSFRQTKMCKKRRLDRVKTFQPGWRRVEHGSIAPFNLTPRVPFE